MSQPSTSSPPSRGSGCLVALVVTLVIVAILFVVAALAMFAIFPSAAKTQLREAEQHPAVGRQLPSVVFEPLTGVDRRLTLEDLAGKVVLVNFWGTWCPPCRVELPYIGALAERFRGHPAIQVIAVSVPPAGQPEDLDTLRQETIDYLKSEELDLPTYADPGRQARRAFARISGPTGFQAVPTTFVLDARGVVRAVWVGFDSKTPQQMLEVIRELQAEQPPPPAENPVVSAPPGPDRSRG